MTLLTQNRLREIKNMVNLLYNHIQHL